MKSTPLKMAGLECATGLQKAYELKVLIPSHHLEKVN
jgi:hypothetical protein